MKLSSLGIYAGIFALLIAIVATGYRAPQPAAVATITSPEQTQTTATKTSVNEVVATNIAASVAETTNLSVANNVANLSVSLAAKSELAQADDTVISKPQIVAPSADRRTIVTYKAKSGDTVGDLAVRYGVSAETIRWANNLTSDALENGRTVKIPPVDGVVYTVKSGDTINSIASKYRANKERIIAFNDLELGGLTRGAKLIIPAGQLPATERPGYSAPQTYTGSSSGSSYSSVQGYYGGGGTVGNRYAAGYCTWYVYERRAQLGRPVGSFWGNANTWAVAAAGSGYRVNNTPAVGAVMQTASGGGGYGHVAVVESIDSRGNITVSEMNYAGWNVISSRTISAGSVGLYRYIH